VYVRSLTLKNFRCFRNATFNFDAPFVIIEGDNGVGKTSILEALYYACYLKSFRTHTSDDLIATNTDHFFVHLDVEQPHHPPHTINIGFSPNKKLIKLDQKTVRSHKDLIAAYRVMSVTEDDLELIKGEPAVRRAFINQAHILHDPEHIAVLRHYKKILLHRNSLLARAHAARALTTELHDELRLWSEQLWARSREMQRGREALLAQIIDRANTLLNQYFPEDSLNISHHYLAKNMRADEDFESFWRKAHSKVIGHEIALERSLFGAHLDDIIIEFRGKNAKQFASRGQQKLILFLIKLSSKNFSDRESGNGNALLLLDDFLTDFDKKRLERCLAIINAHQLNTIVTCPVQAHGLFKKTSEQQLIALTQSNKK
jgi:DNA replication and repair protein RecF